MAQKRGKDRGRPWLTNGPLMVLGLLICLALYWVLNRDPTYTNLKYGIQEKRGAAATRNAGLRMARGELILFIDDDVQAEPDLIRSHLEYQRQNPGASVIGAVTRELEV